MRHALGAGAWDALPAQVREILIANGPALVAEVRGGFPDVTVDQLGTIAQPTLFVGADDSAFDYAETARAVLGAMPSAEVEWVEGGHAIDPAHPVVLSFIDRVLGER